VETSCSPCIERDGRLSLFFKRLKQCLRLHQLLLKDWERASCAVQLNLIVWWRQEQEARWMGEVLTRVLEPLAEDVHHVSEDEESQGEQEAEESILSSWTLGHFGCPQVPTM
jgi:hypothetical protein